MKVERAVELLRRVTAERRAMLRHDVSGLRSQYKTWGKKKRRDARKAKGVEKVRHTKAAQMSEDAARDVGKLLALLDAIEATIKVPGDDGRKETTK